MAAHGENELTEASTLEMSNLTLTLHSAARLHSNDVFDIPRTATLRP